MRQKEVTDKNNTRWTCVQAYGGLSEKNVEKATELTEDREGEITVVCTPSGGAQTVRLKLKENWEEMPDEELLEAIVSAGG